MLVSLLSIFFFVFFENVSILSLAILNVVIYCSDHCINLFLVFSLFGIVFLREEFLYYDHSNHEDYFGFVSMLITSCFSKCHILFSYPAYQNLQSLFPFSMVLLTTVSFLITTLQQLTSPAIGTKHWLLLPSGDRIYLLHFPLTPLRDASFCLKSFQQLPFSTPQ